MLNFGASKPRVRGGPGPRAPPGSAPVKFQLILWFMLLRNAKVTKRRTKLGRNVVIVGNGSLSGGKRATLNSEINLQNQIPKEPCKKVKPCK